MESIDGQVSDVKGKALATFIPIELEPDGRVDVVIKGDNGFRDYLFTDEFTRVICSGYKR